MTIISLLLACYGNPKDTAGRELREEMTMWRHTVGLIVMLTLGVLVVPLATDAQRPGKIPRIGFLGDTPGPHAEALRQGLHDVGYMEGQNLVIEYRWPRARASGSPPSPPSWSSSRWT
jgi:hypothetical protein